MDFVSYFAFAATIACILWMVYIAFKGDPARDEEEAARTFFDEHGRWPDDPVPGR